MQRIACVLSCGMEKRSLSISSPLLQNSSSGATEVACTARKSRAITDSRGYRVLFTFHHSRTSVGIGAGGSERY
ncbi:hypothetical protein CISIN_1g035103mg [Citrus sinensis]|uniref:Uncharacterized protein n=1 Tax=Citrus sinensis TaxID=2711 RepID=A0A067FQR5_CITSI|nr:hypothetical protein CISIN_1g035103mg [Citrus sinensis]